MAKESSRLKLAPAPTTAGNAAPGTDPDRRPASSEVDDTSVTPPAGWRVGVPGASELEVTTWPV